MDMWIHFIPLARALVQAMQTAVELAQLDGGGRRRRRPRKPRRPRRPRKPRPDK
jgi:hypothetical protein